MRDIFVSAYTAVMSIVTIIVTTVGITYNFPDFVHIDHGFPFVWGTHTLSTIVGAVDLWNVNLPFLAADLSIWLGALLIGVIVLNRYLHEGMKESQVLRETKNE